MACPYTKQYLSWHNASSFQGRPGQAVSFAHLLEINRQRGQPLYKQIAEQIKLQISEGRLPVGTQLPTVRYLAESLDIARVTAQNAYGELQAEGWIESTVGRGTYVIAPPRNQDLLTAVSQHTTPDSIMGDIQRINQIVGLRSFAYAEPDPALYPIEDFWSSLINLSADAVALMQYGGPQGDEMLRIELTDLLVERGITVLPDELLVISGVSQGLSLVTQALASAGDKVVIEQPVYLGLFPVLSANNIQPVGVPLDSEGIRLDCLEQVVREHRPRFLYTVPNFQNPTGICMSEQRRRDLMALAERFNLPIVEDDIYGQIAFSTTPGTLKSLDRNGLVFYLSSLSKVLMPGLRIGYLVAPSAYRERLTVLRQTADLSGPLLLQRASAHFLHKGRLKAHLRRVLPRYRERRDVLLKSLEQMIPDGISWTQPDGGFCCWVTGRMPQDFYHTALRRGVAFTPGSVFLTEPDKQQHIRLCFAGLTPEVIEEGIEILGDLLRGSPLQRLRGHDLPLV